VSVQRDDGQALVDRAECDRGYRRVIDVADGFEVVSRLPSLDGSIFGGEDENVAGEIRGRTVENYSRRRRSGGAVGCGRDRYDERHLLRDVHDLPITVVKCRYSGVVVENPEGRVALHQAPGIEQILVADFPL